MKRKKGVRKRMGMKTRRPRQPGQRAAEDDEGNEVDTKKQKTKEDNEQRRKS